MLSSLGRGATLAVVLIVTAVVGLIVFTAVGLGGDPAPKAVAKATPTPVPKAKAPLAQYSSEVGRRESGQPGADGVALSETPPVPPQLFRGPIDKFKRYSLVQARQLKRDVATLKRAIAGGSRTRSEAAWRTAFARYLNIGAVYGALGDIDTKIDGLPGSLPGGLHDQHFTGLHRLEAGLWGDQPVRSLLPVANRLVSDVNRLPRVITTEQVDLLDFSLRVHEILEDAQRDFLDGQDVRASDEGVLATNSGVVATKAMLRAVHPLLLGKDPTLPTEAAVDQLAVAFAQVRRAHHGRFPTVSGLRRPERELLEARLGAALERLQMIPEALATSDPVAIPKLTP